MPVPLISLWFYQEGADKIFPDYWQDFLEPIPEAERNDLMQAYHSRLTGPDELIRMKAAKAWSIWEARCSNLQHNAKVLEAFSDPHMALSLARIECHYFVNRIFLPENYLLEQVGKLAGIPGILVHGRYDVVCPIDQAFASASRLAGFAFGSGRRSRSFGTGARHHHRSDCRDEGDASARDQGVTRNARHALV